MKIAVDFQNLLSPTALTRAATHDGPKPPGQLTWSESSQTGVIQVKFASLTLRTSVMKRQFGEITSFFQSGPL